MRSQIQQRNDVDRDLRAEVIRELLLSPNDYDIAALVTTCKNQAAARGPIKLEHILVRDARVEAGLTAVSSLGPYPPPPCVGDVAVIDRPSNRAVVERVAIRVEDADRLAARGREDGQTRR